MIHHSKEYYVDYTSHGMRLSQRFLTWDAACDFAMRVSGEDVIGYGKRGSTNREVSGYGRSV